MKMYNFCQSCSKSTWKNVQQKLNLIQSNSFFRLLFIFPFISLIIVVQLIKFCSTEWSSCNLNRPSSSSSSSFIFIFQFNLFHPIEGNLKLQLLIKKMDPCWVVHQLSRLLVPNLSAIVEPAERKYWPMNHVTIAIPVPSLSVKIVHHILINPRKRWVLNKENVVSLVKQMYVNTIWNIFFFHFNFYLFTFNSSAYFWM